MVSEICLVFDHQRIIYYFDLWLTVQENPPSVCNGEGVGWGELIASVKTRDQAVIDFRQRRTDNCYLWLLDGLVRIPRIRYVSDALIRTERICRKNILL